MSSAKLSPSHSSPASTKPLPHCTCVHTRGIRITLQKYTHQRTSIFNSELKNISLRYPRSHKITARFQLQINYAQSQFTCSKEGKNAHLGQGDISTDNNNCCISHIDSLPSLLSVHVGSPCIQHICY